MARSTWGASWWGGRRRKTQAQARPGLAGVRAHSHSAGFMLHEDSERTTRGGHAPAQGYAYSYSELMPPSSIFKDVTDSAAVSTASLPMPIDALGSPPRVMPCDAVAANFILDTSLPYSLIARDTLRALGYTRVPSNGDDNFSHRRGGAQDADHDDSDGEEEDDEEDEDEEDDDKRKRRKEKERDAEVEVTIQGVQTKARVARAGEAGRLGVQFLRDAGVSVFFPREEGVGPVLYCEFWFLFSKALCLVVSGWSL
ncbi:hypothetical protein BDN70DRAFT_20834 [Pholiota conissans]|uniref:Uncharacterized protein n=1 Tax=Pholiota conissans TaxID=109636 RepID=A0A9P5ZF39_9AGAR|nr:hypothetical protein BDN70DRAFT_20834 [Pholiota conissans]